MSPPLPIPSKAAIHTLRGLALGTSCAIGVIVEHRRRRISILKTAVANKEKLKASRHYHGALEYGTLPVDADNAILFNSNDLQWHQQSEKHDDHDEYPRASPPRWKKSTKTPETSDSRNADKIQISETPDLENVSDTQEQPTEPLIQQAQITSPQMPGGPPKKEPPHTEPKIARVIRPPKYNTETWGPKLTSPSKYSPKPINPVSLASSIQEILSSHDEERLDRALAKFFTCPETSYMLQQCGDAWLDVTSRLSKECQAQSRWEDAHRVLSRVLEGSPIDESWYYAHDPIPIIESCLPPATSEFKCSAGAFSKALPLFMAAFTKKPESNVPDVERIGKRLIMEAVNLGRLASIHSIFWRVLGLMDDGCSFTSWVIKTLSDFHDYKNVVKYFLLNFSKMNPRSDALFNETLNCVVGAVEAMQGMKASQVFRAYARMSTAGDGSLRTRWIMRLLQAHWNRHQDYSQTKALFDEAKTLGLLHRVAHPQGVYRVMVELAIKADEQAMAEFYYDEVLQTCPWLHSDIPLKGYFAVAKAKAGDWDGVYNDFTKMQARRHLQQEEYNDAFIAILKIFAEDHPVAEVRDFVARYVDDLGVGMHRYMVTLVANKYGQCRDITGFLSWLDYCNKAGFSLDPVFCNAVLHNCRTQWKFHFEQLRQLVSTIRRLNPGATDDSTKRILSQSSRSSTPMVSPNVSLSSKGKPVRIKTISMNKLAYVGRSMNKRDVYEAMNQEIGSGKHIVAVTIYKRAMRFGMPFCSHCFRLAVTASLELPGHGTGLAFHLIHNAHEQGHDVTFAVSTFIRTQMDQFRGSPVDVIQHMQNLISRFEALRVVIDPAALTHAALVCIKLGHHDKALSLCRVAMERSGAPDNPCFSRQCFRALLKVYTQTLDLNGLEELLTALLANHDGNGSGVGGSGNGSGVGGSGHGGCDFSFEKKTLLTLRMTIKAVQSYRQDPATIAMLDLLQRGIDEVRRIRVEKQQEGKVIAQETLRIMGDALADFESRKQAEEKTKSGKTAGRIEWEREQEWEKRIHANSTQHSRPLETETTPQQQQGWQQAPPSTPRDGLSVPLVTSKA